MASNFYWSKCDQASVGYARRSGHRTFFGFRMVSGTRFLVADLLSAKGFKLGPPWDGLVLHAP